MRNVIGLVNFHCEPKISPLTDSRPLGSTSFIGRYAFCDFALSNLCNSGISNVGLLVQDHQRSILKHLGSMDSWVINTKIGRQRILYNEPAHLDPRLNTDVNNLLENDWVLYDSACDALVLVPSHMIMSIDLRPYIEEHFASGHQITLLASMQRNLAKSWIGARVFEFGEQEGVPVAATRNVGQFPKQHAVYLDIAIINRKTIVDILARYAAPHPGEDLISLIMLAQKDRHYDVNVAYFDGFVRYVDSFSHYMEYCLELLDHRKADLVFLKDWPIYTLTHDTPPAVYGATAEVRNSYISNGSIINGKVVNSIISRNVTVGKGAVVKNSIIFSTVKINEGAVIENALVDKYGIVERDHVIKGKGKAPIYLHQGAIV